MQFGERTVETRIVRDEFVRVIGLNERERFSLRAAVMKQYTQEQIALDVIDSPKTGWLEIRFSEHRAMKNALGAERHLDQLRDLEKSARTLIPQVMEM